MENDEKNIARESDLGELSGFTQERLESDTLSESRSGVSEFGCRNLGVESFNIGGLSEGVFVVSPETAELSRNIEDYPHGIVIPIDKPYRWTSADVIRKVKNAAIRHFGKKNLKVGHAGTLDPLATGILLVCIGNATKLAQSLQDHDKEYVAGISFGATTPSYDLEKDIDRKFPYEHITEELLRARLSDFIGEQEQVAPLFSAKMVGGVRAYELARKLYNYRRREEQSGGQDGQSEGLQNGAVYDAAAGELLRVAKIRIASAELLGFWPAGNTIVEDRQKEMALLEGSASLMNRSENNGSSVLEKVDGGDSCESVFSRDDMGDRYRGNIEDVSMMGGSIETEENNGSSVLKKVDGGDSCESVFSREEEGNKYRNKGMMGDGTVRDDGGNEVIKKSGASGRINVADTVALRLPHADIRLACSKGTYIRAFARDLGEALSSGAHLDSLCRTKSGPFTLARAVSLPCLLRKLSNFRSLP